MHFKSNPSYDQSTLNVDRENSTINNVVIAQFGENKNYSYFNNQFLEDLSKQGNDQKQGVKSRFGHPNMCATSLGTYIGRYKGFEVKDNKVFANLHLDPIAKKTQVEGKGISMDEYILDMAETNSDMFGNSIVINAEYFEELDDEGNVVHEYSLKLESFIASDLVDEPAATDALFSNSDDLGIIMTEFLDENPSIFSALEKDPSIFIDFIDRYENYSNNNKSNKKMNFKDKLKKLFGKEESFDIEVTTGAGDIVTVVTENENPAEGDSVNNADGSSVEDGDLVIADGTIWVIADGKISEIKEEETPEGSDDEPTNEEVMQSVNALTTSFGKFQKQYKKDKKNSQKDIEFVATTLNKKFKTLASSVKSKSPEYKQTKKEKKKFNQSGYDADAVSKARKERKTKK